MRPRKDELFWSIDRCVGIHPHGARRGFQVIDFAWRLERLGFLRLHRGRLWEDAFIRRRREGQTALAFRILGIAQLDRYRRDPIGLGEFGMAVTAGDAALATFFTNVRSKFAAAGLAWGVFFNRSRDINTMITTGSYQSAVSAFAASLA